MRPDACFRPIDEARMAIGGEGPGDRLPLGESGEVGHDHPDPAIFFKETDLHLDFFAAHQIVGIEERNVFPRRAAYPHAPRESWTPGVWLKDVPDAAPVAGHNLPRVVSGA